MCVTNGPPWRRITNNREFSTTRSSAIQLPKEYGNLQISATHLTTSPQKPFGNNWQNDARDVPLPTGKTCVISIAAAMTTFAKRTSHFELSISLRKLAPNAMILCERNNEREATLCRHLFGIKFDRSHCEDMSCKSCSSHSNRYRSQHPLSGIKAFEDAVPLDAHWNV
jgi:hypothetical protein